MSKGLHKVLDFEDGNRAARTETEGLYRRVMQLFAPSDAAALAESEMAEQVSAIGQQFLRTLNISPEGEVETLFDSFKDTEIPLEPRDITQYLKSFNDSVVVHSIHTSSPRFIGHMTSSLPYFIRPLAALMTTMNQNVVKLETSRAMTLYERQSIGLIHRLIYNCSDGFYQQHMQSAKSTLGALVSGGTLANITGLWCARNSALGPKGGFKGVEEEGLVKALSFYGYDGAVIIGSSMMHYSIEKAACLLGIGSSGLIKVRTGPNYRIDLERLRKVVAECRAQKLLIIAIVAVAGSTDTGSIDPLVEMAEIAAEAEAHFHVDAAWGGALLFSEQHKRKLRGIELADSVTVDGHKQLYLPMGIGMVMFRDPRLPRVIEKTARYIVRPGSLDLGRRTLEGSRAGMALFLHAALSLIGQRGYELLINEGVRKTRHMARAIEALPEFELLVEPEMNILNYRYIPEEYRAAVRQDCLTEAADRAINDFNERLQKSQRKAGFSFVSRTMLDDTRRTKDAHVVSLRAVIANPLTTEADIDATLKDQMTIAARLRAVRVPIDLRHSLMKEKGDDHR